MRAAEKFYCDTGEIDALPWNEMEVLQSETSLIKEDLLQLNRAGYLTINSQPSVNGLSSTDPKHGWGGAGGFVPSSIPAAPFCLHIAHVHVPQ